MKKFSGFFVWLPLISFMFFFLESTTAGAEQLRCSSSRDYALEGGSLKITKSFNEIFFINTVTGKVIGDGPVQSSYNVIAAGNSATTLKLQNEYKTLILIYWERPKSFIFTDMRTGHVITGTCN